MVWVLTEVFAPSEVGKPVLPSELVLVCWGYSEVEYFHSESVLAVVTRVKYVSVVEMLLYARCGKYYLSHFFLHHDTKIKEVSSGALHNCNYVSNGLL